MNLKCKGNNKGLSLIELIISLAILSMITVGIIGTMTSNTNIYRKSKQDIGVQNTAQFTFNKLGDSIEQADYIYAEGYVVKTGNTDELPVFSSTKVGADYSVSSSAAPTLMKIVKNPAEDDADNVSVLGGKESGLTAFTDPSVNGKYFYPLKIIIRRKETSYDPSNYSAGKLTDTVVETYTFDENKIRYKEIYTTNQNMNTKTSTTSDQYAAPDLLAAELNYVKAGNSIPFIPGCRMKFDAESDSVAMTMYFADRSKSYTSDGMVDIKNSYVLHDAK